MVKSKSSDSLKVKTLFDHVNAVFSEQDPDYFSKLSEGDKKTWSNFMLNRFISMNPDYIEVINYVQKYSVDLSPELYYKVLIDVIPKRRQFNKYIKASKTSKFEEWLIDLFVLHYKVSIKEATEYLEILSLTKEGRADIENTCRKYGTDDKIINSIFGEKPTKKVKKKKNE